MTFRGSDAPSLALDGSDAPSLSTVRALTVRSLRIPATVFAVGVAVHGADHMRRGMAASPMSITAAGTVQFLLVIVTVIAVWLGRRWAPGLAIFVTAASIVGFTYAHLLPSWFPAYSDSYVTGPRIGVTWFSWVTVIAELGTAAILGVAAWRVRRGVLGDDSFA